MKVAIIEPGIYHDVPFDEYRSIQAANASSLKMLDKSPLAYLHACTNISNSTPSKTLGTAIHAAILEPDRFDSEYTVFKERRSGKAWEAFKEKNNGRQILSTAEYDKILSMQEAVCNHEFADGLLSGGESEVTLVWNDVGTGILCKARIDYLNITERTIIDLKSTKDASSFSFSRDFANYCYHVSIAHYINGVRSLIGGEFSTYVIAVENSEPYDVVPYEVTDSVYSAGKKKRKEQLEKLKRCQRNNEYPGISGTPLELELPAWAGVEEKQELIIGGEKVEV